jgi:hypothetical protein
MCSGIERGCPIAKVLRLFPFAPFWDTQGGPAKKPSGPSVAGIGSEIFLPH